MSTGLYTHRTRNAGEIVRDTLYNPAHKNHQQNDIPNQAGALSDDTTEYQTTQDPAPGGVVNLITSVEEEFQQLRFALEDIKTALLGGTPPAEWYTPISIDATAAAGKGARVHRSSSQAISFKTLTAVIFNTIDYDTGVVGPTTDPFFDIGTPTRLTAPVDGIYQFNGFAEWSAGADGPVSALLRVNGTEVVAASEWFTDGVQVPQLSVSTQYSLAAGDYVELVMFQVATALTLDVNGPDLAIELLAPTATIAPATQFTLTITENGTGSGTVTSDVGGINCPGTCSASYGDGTLVTLTATPTIGSFVEWTGDLPVSPDPTNPIVVTMDQARSIGCTFTAFTLSITEGGTGAGVVTSDIGSINCPGVCDDQYAINDVVALTAVPTVGAFVQWSGDIDPGEEFNNPGNVTMDSDKTVVVEFAMTSVLASFSATGAVTGTRYLCPSTVMVVSTTIAGAAFTMPIAAEIIGLYITMTVPLPVAHTYDAEFNINGVNDATIHVSLIAGETTDFATGSITLAAFDTLCIEAIQVGGGGDTIQCLTIVYRPL